MLKSTSFMASLGPSKTCGDTNNPSGRDTSGLKHGTGRNKDIVLVPQPSESPRDPLNWSLWKKDLLLVIISLDTAVVGAWFALGSLNHDSTMLTSI